MSTSAVKGAALREFLLWYEAHHDVEPVRRAARALPPDFRHLLDVERRGFGVLPSVWYPSPIVHAMLDAVAAGRTRDEMRALVRAANAAVVPRATHGVYRMLFQKVVSPSLYARFIQPFWRQLHTTGRREVKIESQREAVSYTRDWEGHHPLLCDITQETMFVVFKLITRSEVRLERLACVSDGDPECAARLRW